MDEALKEHGFSSISATEGDENQTEEKKEETFNKKNFCCEKHYKLFEQASRSIRYYYKSASRPFIKQVETSLRQSFEISTGHKPSQWLPDQFCRFDINRIQTNRQTRQIYIYLDRLKGLQTVTSSDPPFIEWHVLSTMVPLNTLSDQA